MKLSQLKITSGDLVFAEFKGRSQYERESLANEIRLWATARGLNDVKVIVSTEVGENSITVLSVNDPFEEEVLK